ATPLLTFVLLLATGSQGVADAKPVVTQQEKEAALVQFAENHFARWDHNCNGILELEEIDRQVENHSVRGREAAVVVCIRRHLASKDNQPRLSREELLALFRDRAFEKFAIHTQRQASARHREQPCLRPDGL
ncbi:MAG: hypothetical protein ABSG53_25855, partial [Thermoguttaceae bacterium]